MSEWEKRVEETRRIIKLRRVRDAADAEIARLRAERSRRERAKAIADAVTVEREACAEMLDDAARIEKMAAGNFLVEDRTDEMRRRGVKAAALRQAASWIRARGTAVPQDATDPVGAAASTIPSAPPSR